MAAAEGSAPARAALAGNPSDGYGGAVLAVALPELRARVRVQDAARDAVEPGSALVQAAARRFERRFGPGPPCALRWRTDVPREVGLAGSSALVIATLRALGAWRDVALEPDALAAMALAVEVDDLGIAAGPQDRVAQAYGGLTFMDFGPEGRHEPLDPALLPPLFVAWRRDAHAPSRTVHGDLRRRFAAGDRDVAAAMRRLAGHARAARDALLVGDGAELDRRMDASFDERRAIVALDPRHERMVHVARAHGASANYAGSGGAVVGTCPDSAWPALERALRAEACTVVRPRVA